MTQTLTQKQIDDLDRMNVASQRAGGLGTFLMGGASLPDAGTLKPVVFVKYTTTPALGTATATKAAIPLTASAQTGVTAGITQPDFPRVLSAKGNASGITGNVVISGTDAADAVITDTIALNGATEVAGAKAFKTVTSINYPAESHAGTDTVSIGRQNLIGFLVAIPNASQVVAKSFNGAVDAGSVTAAATVAGSLYTPAGTLDGAKLLELTYFA